MARMRGKDPLRALIVVLCLFLNGRGKVLTHLFDAESLASACNPCAFGMTGTIRSDNSYPCYQA